MQNMVHGQGSIPTAHPPKAGRHPDLTIARGKPVRQLSVRRITLMPKHRGKQKKYGCDVRSLCQTSTRIVTIILSTHTMTTLSYTSTALKSSILATVPEVALP